MILDLASRIPHGDKLLIIFIFQGHTHTLKDIPDPVWRLLSNELLRLDTLQLIGFLILFCKFPGNCLQVVVTGNDTSVLRTQNERGNPFNFNRDEVPLIAICAPCMGVVDVGVVIVVITVFINHMVKNV